MNDWYDEAVKEVEEDFENEVITYRELNRAYRELEEELREEDEY